MPELTSIEDTFLKELEDDAKSLLNGHSGDIGRLCKVVAGSTRVIVAMARTGGVSPAECRAAREQCAKAKQPGNWKVALAVAVPACLTAYALLGPFFQAAAK
jgi:hypothetical protein